MKLGLAVIVIALAGCISAQTARDAPAPISPEKTAPAIEPTKQNATPTPMPSPTPTPAPTPPPSYAPTPTPTPTTPATPAWQPQFAQIESWSHTHPNSAQCGDVPQHLYSAILYNQYSVSWKDVRVNLKEFGINGKMNVNVTTDVGPVKSGGAFQAQVCWPVGMYPDEPYRYTIEYLATR